MNEELITELRARHSILGPCPGPQNELCLRCRAAQEIDALNLHVRVLAQIVVELMNEVSDTPIAAQLRAAIAEAEIEYEFPPFWD